MDIEDEKHLDFLANEAFIRRAARVDFPVMLKGSFLTRQYMPELNYRRANDLDWVYLKYLNDPEDIGQHLDLWMTMVTGMDIYDGVEFVSFTKNAFWRRIEYAMNDDFPTVNTDVSCTVNGQPNYVLQIDVSFNIPVVPAPIPLIYKPIEGEEFWLAFTCPLSLQVAWKLHQTLVRPRLKDLFDLIYLTAHPEFDRMALQACMQALVNECAADKINPQVLCKYLDGSEVERIRIEAKNPNAAANYAWNSPLISPTFNAYEVAHFTDFPERVPGSMLEVLEMLKQALFKVGITPDLMAHLPKPTRDKRH